MIRRSILLACTLLAACEAPRDDLPRSDATATASASAQKSIMRPDVEMPEATPTPLAPLKLSIRFPDRSDELPPAAVPSLEGLVASPQVASGGVVHVDGHSDAGGSDAANLAISRKRAELVRDWLVEHGIAHDRIAVVAFGEQNPIEPNALPDGEPNEEGRAANRRVDIRVDVRNDPAAPARTGTIAETLGNESP